MLTGALRTVFVALVGGATLGLVAMGAVLTWVDPVDRNYCRKTRETWSLNRDVPACTLCKIQLSSAGTKHCNSCNKCVGELDHHCVWTNNCVGGKNYRLFIVLIGILEAYAIFFAGFICVSIYSVIDGDIGLSIGVPLYIVIACFFLVESLTLIILNSALIVFHIWLRCKGMKTLDFFVYYLNKERVVPEEVTQRLDASPRKLGKAEINGQL